MHKALAFLKWPHFIRVVLDKSKISLKSYWVDLCNGLSLTRNWLFYKQGTVLLMQAWFDRGTCAGVGFWCIMRLVM